MRSPMWKTAAVFVAAASIGVMAAVQPVARGADLRLPVSQYRDKMKAGWIGQMAGVGWGAPTEFRYKGRIIPADEMPAVEARRWSTSSTRTTSTSR